jgi:hypothetical protein
VRNYPATLYSCGALAFHVEMMDGAKQGLGEQYKERFLRSTKKDVKCNATTQSFVRSVKALPE